MARRSKVFGPRCSRRSKLFCFDRAANKHGASEWTESDDVCEAKNPYDVPGVPGKPKISGVTRDAMTVFWDAPENDGGAVITRYILEKRSRSNRKWMKATSDEVGGTQHRVRGLREGQEYAFRVAAVNAAGQGDFSPASDLLQACAPVSLPSAPHPSVREVTKDSIRISWIPPDSDGGGKIKGYIVEKQEDGSDEWQKTSTHQIQSNEFVVPNLRPGKKYLLRVIAANQAGLGEPGYISEPITVEEKLEPPELTLDSSVKGVIVVKAGDSVKAAVRVKGRPLPVVSWKKDGQVLPKEAKIHDELGISSLIIKNSTRAHTGKYSIAAQNCAGEKSLDVEVCVQDVPGPCVGPLEPSNVTRDTVGLSWKQPEDDGGCTITNYVLEKRESLRRSWTRVSMTITRTSVVVQDLVDGESYMFRVSAENMLGVGPSIETAGPVCARDPIAEPGRPEDVRVADVTKNTVSLQWKTPKFDGGAPISEYVVEKRLIGQERYLPATDKMVRDTKLLLDGFSEGDNYEFRVFAKNARGLSPPSLPTKPVVCRDNIQPPSLKLEGRERLISRVGEPFRVLAQVSGRPNPKVTWEHDGSVVSSDDRVGVRTTPSSSALEVQNGLRSDSGVYKVRAHNDGGQREEKIFISVVDKPSPPRDLVVSEVTKHHVILTWSPPEDDGGSELLNYVIEKRETSRMTWSNVNSTTTKSELKISKLNEGSELTFRVMAENAQGCSDPVETPTVVVKDKYRVPDAPDALTVKDVNKNSAVLSWNKPYDGGKAIFNYVVEKRELKSERWVRVTSELINEPRYTVSGLYEGNEYEFCVSAENSIGVGARSLSSKKIVAVNPISSPGQPVNPHITDITKSTLSVEWQKPRHDGGSPVSGYIVETQKAGSEAWKIWCTQETQKTTSFLIPDLVENYEYKVRVTAVNKAGLSEPSFVKGTVVVKEKVEAPELELQASMSREQIIKAGSPLTLSAKVRGKPFPSLIWCCNDQAVETDSEKCVQQVTDGLASISIARCARSDSGRYSLTAENEAGKKTASVVVNVLDTPSAPLHIRVSEIRSDSCYLKWKAPSDNGGAVVSNYKVEKYSSESKIWKPVAIAVKKTSLAVKHLTPSNIYRFRVTAENQFGLGPHAESDEILARDPIHPPGPPKNLGVIDIDKSSLTLSWSKPDRDGGAELSGYAVEYMELGPEKELDDRLKAGIDIDDSEKTWLQFSVVKETNCKVDDLKENFVYKLRVHAVNEAGKSRPDVTMPVTVRQKLVPPSIEIDIKILEGLTARAGSTIRVPATVRGVPIPTVEWAAADGGSLDSNERITITTDNESTLLTIKDALRTDSQEYSLTAKNEAGIKSTGVYVTVLSQPGAPVGPMNILEMTPEYAIIQWFPPKDDGGSPITNYIVEKKDTSKQTWGVVSSKGTRTKCKVPRLIQDKEYVFRVKAENKYGVSEALESIPEIAKHAFDVPDPPSVPQVSEVTESSCTLLWKGPDNDGGSPITGYIVERLEKEAGKWTKVTLDRQLGLTLRVKGLFDGKEYSFRVIAENHAGMSRPSGQSPFILARKPMTVPDAPINLKVTDHDCSSADLSWNRPARDGGSHIRGYFVECKRLDPEHPSDTSVSDWIRVNKEPIDKYVFKVPGLKENNHYFFRVMAVNEVGESEARQTVEPTMIKDIIEEPEVDIDAHSKGKVTVRAGQKIKLSAKVRGRPEPVVDWLKSGTSLLKAADERLKVEKTPLGTDLIVKESKRGDSGAYNLKVKNTAGEKNIKINVNVLDKPEICRNLKVNYITKSSCVVTWDPPEDDGGTEIVNYILEMKEPTLPGFSSLGWTIVSSEGAKKMIKVVLVENHEYLFRVSAENKCGLGPSLELKEPVLATDPIQVPQAPKDLVVTSTGNDFVSIEWQKPEWNGGSEITGYQIVVMKHGSKEWKEICTNKQDCNHTVKDLEEGSQYRFGVMARNKAGLSQVCVTRDYVTVREDVTLPTVKIVTSTVKGEVLARAATNLTIDAKITGKPQPEVVWKVEDTDLFKLPRTSIKVMEDSTRLTISNVSRADCGLYEVTATTKAGNASDRVRVNVLDKPGVCTGPVQIGSVNKDRCTVAWQPPADDGGCEITNYLVEKCETSRMVWSVVTASVTACTHSIPRLLEGNEYIFRVKAENKMGVGPGIESSPVVAKNPFDKPGPPLSVVVTKIGKDHAVVTWKAPEKDGGKEITGYYVEKREKKGVRWSPCNSKSTSDMRFSVIGLSTGYDYQFRVLAESDVGIGEPSDPTKMVTIKEPVEVPGPPSNPKVVDTSKTSVTLQWGPPAYDGGSPIIGYIVESSVVGLDDWRKFDVGVKAAKNTEFAVTGLRPEQTYSFRVSAVNEVGAGRVEYVAEAVQPKEVLEEPDVELDAEMRRVVEVKAGSTLHLMATVRGRPTPSVKWSKQGATLSRRADVDLTGLQTSVAIPDCSRDDAGKYLLTVSNAKGTKTMGINVKVLDSPGPVNNIIVKDVTENSAQISWSQPEVDGGSEVFNYHVEKKEADKKTWSVATNDCSKTAFRIMKLVEGKDYYFRIKAENKFGVGPPAETSKPVRAKHPISEPGPVNKLKVTDVTKSTVSLSWIQPDHSGGSRITGYVVEYQGEGSANWIVYRTLTDTSVTVLNLVNKKYQFRIKAVNEELEGPWTMTEVIEVKEQAEPPNISLPKELRIKAGEKGVIEAAITGKPHPVSYWMHRDAMLTESDRLLIQKMPGGSTLTITKSKRVDSGEYAVRAENPHGKKQALINVQVLDRPSTPLGPVEFKDVNIDTLTLMWNPPEDDGGCPISNYVVEQSEATQPGFRVINSTVSRTTLRVSKLSKDSEYVFRIKAENKYGVSDALSSSVVQTTYPFKPPGPPRNLCVVKIGKSSATLSWAVPESDGGNPVRGYNVERKEINSLLWTAVSKSLIRRREIVDSSLLEGIEYVFRVQACNTAGYGPFSDPTDPHLARDPCDPPGKPVVVDVTNNSVEISWTAPRRDGGSKLAGYIIEKQHLPGEKWTRHLTTKGEQTSTILENLEEGERYCFRVIAKTALVLSKPSEPSETVLVRQAIAPPEITMDASCNRIVEVRAGQDIVIEAHVSGKPKPTSTWKHGDKEMKSVSDGSVVVETALNRSQLKIRSCKRSDAGNYTLFVNNPSGTKSANVIVRVLDVPGPPQESKFSQVFADKLKLSWNPPDEDGGSPIRNYVVERRETSRPTWAMLSGSIQATELFVTKLIENHEYEFRISAENKYGIGLSLVTDSIVAKNPFSVPFAPEPPAVSNPTKDSVTLTWKSPDDGGKPISGYYVEKREIKSGQWSKVNRRPMSDRTWKVTGLSEGCEYEFRIVAENVAGLGKPSQPSRPVLAEDPKYPPGPPTAPKVVDTTKSSVDLTWGEPAFDGESPITGYIVEMASPESPEKYERVAATHITKHTVTSLTEGRDYRFRIKATNAIGDSDPADVQGSVVPKDILEAPSLELDATLTKTLVVRAGGTIRLYCTLQGRPAPRVSWSKVDGELSINRVEIKTSDWNSLLLVPNCNRDDSGKYKISLENSSGTKTAVVQVRVQDSPGPPGPIKFKEVTLESVSLSWNEPDIDGGSPVTNYIVEKRESTRKAWATVATQCTRTSWTVAKLETGKSYFFRVMAENEFGVGLPYETPEPVKATQEPGPVQRLEVTETTNSSVNISWHKPIHDGGSRLTGYVVEVAPKDTDDWEEVADVRVLSYKVNCLAIQKVLFCTIIVRCNIFFFLFLALWVDRRQKLRSSGCCQERGRYWPAA